MTPSPAEIVTLSTETAPLLDAVAEEVFDHAIRADSLAAFLASTNHHMVLAIADGQVVGMASAVVYLHPDKPPQLWINEVGVGREYRRRGIGTRLTEHLLELAWDLGCAEAWLATEEENAPARALYSSLVARRASATERDKPVVLFSWRRA